MLGLSNNAELLNEMNSNALDRLDFTLWYDFNISPLWHNFFLPLKHTEKTFFTSKKRMSEKKNLCIIRWNFNSRNSPRHFVRPTEIWTRISWTQLYLKALAGTFSVREEPMLQIFPRSFKRRRYFKLVSHNTSYDNIFLAWLDNWVGTDLQTSEPS